MKTLMTAAVIAAALITATSAQADMGKGARAAAKTDAAIGFETFDLSPEQAILNYLIVKNPQALQTVDAGNGDACLADGAEADKACAAAFQQIIAGVRSLLTASYGLSQSMGRFDPTSVSYSKGLTQSLLTLDPQRNI